MTTSITIHVNGRCNAHVLQDEKPAVIIGPQEARTFFLSDHGPDASSIFTIRESPLPNVVSNSAHDIGWAVKQALDGKKITRNSWNGKGMFLIWVKGTEEARLKPGTPYARALPADKFSVDIGGHMDMFTAAGVFQPGWVCSQADLVATDWALVD